MERSLAESMFMEKRYNCAQSVLGALTEELGLDTDTALRIASSFGAGMVQMQETCGAVTGGLMALGLRYGFTDPADQEQRALCTAKSKEFISAFRAAFGTISCRELLGCDLSTPEGQKFFADNNQREAICNRCVGEAVAIIKQLQS